MSESSIRIAPVQLPSFGRVGPGPTIPAELYRARIEQTLERMRLLNWDALLVYADREHCANLAYLTGFDPRFEEALLLLSSGGAVKLLVGNECLGYLPDVKALNIEVELFQEFSLMGQSRDDSRPLRAILKDFGIATGQRVGCAGWKFFKGPLIDGGEGALDVPAFIADVVRDLVGDRGLVVNGAGIFMDAQEGLRVINEPVQIAQFEQAACIVSDGLLKLLEHLRPGVAEDALEKHLDARGLPLSCHRMISFGEKARRGLASPAGGRGRLGEAFTTAFGVQGALSCRAGVLAHSPRDLPVDLREYYDAFVKNYFQVVVAWYEAVRVGAKARAVVRAVERVRNKRLFRLALNPGHYLHLDEWLHSPFTKESEVILGSGMSLQMDIIPVSLGPFCCSNAEDGVVLADPALRARLARDYPEMWRRIELRRAFMGEALGIQLDASVLPLSNLTGWFPPYALDLERALVQSKR